jgi:uridine kinase
MVIGICGGSGSGKTTVLKRLANEFAHFKPSVFSLDNYYKSIDFQEKDLNGVVNFDLPTALNRESLINDLNSLIAGQAITVSEYQFNVASAKPNLIQISPSKLLIVEGIFLLEYNEIFEKLDFTIFMEVDLKIQYARRLKRDQDKRGYSEFDIKYQWDNHVLPCYDNYINPYKEKCDFIFHNDERMEDDYEYLSKILDEKLEMQFSS